MIIMVAGSRTWDLVSHIEKNLLWYTRGASEVTLIHGGARGADSIAHKYGLKRSWEIITFLPHYDLYGKNATHVRNQLMIDMLPDVVLGFIRNRSNGTMSVMEKAAKARLRFQPFYYEDYV